MNEFPVKTVGGIVIGIVSLIVLAIVGMNTFETNLAGHLQVKQAALRGTLSCQTEPGMYGQWFGDIHEYMEAETFFFTKDKETGEERDQSLPTMFNDGASAKISGSLRVLMPKTCEQLVAIHRKFHSMEGVMEKLVLPAVRKALFTAGPHMSSAESYAERRGEFAMLVEDQLVNGTILTEKSSVEGIDELTGQKRALLVVNKRTCEQEGGTCIGGFLRDISAFHEFGVTATNFVVDDIAYSSEVIAQIELQRKARMDIITQQAEAKQADARASKAEAEARAQVAETRAKEEVAKTQMVVRAEAKKAEAVLEGEQKKAVAELDRDAASSEKAANILRGEGEAARRKAVMEADGALEKKLAAWLEAQKAYAEALAKAQPGALVPTVVMGQNGGQASNASAWMDIMTVKASRDLAVDVTPGRREQP